MRKELPLEIQDFHKLDAEIANLGSRLSDISKDIIKKYCPYSLGAKVYYWEHHNKEVKKCGKVWMILFKGIDSDVIDNKWHICIQPMTKDFSREKKQCGVWLKGKNAKIELCKHEKKG